jgi:hypothetical protein
MAEPTSDEVVVLESVRMICCGRRYLQDSSPRAAQPSSREESQGRTRQAGSAHPQDEISWLERGTWVRSRAVRPDRAAPATVWGSNLNAGTFVSLIQRISLYAAATKAMSARATVTGDSSSLRHLESCNFEPLTCPSFGKGHGRGEGDSRTRETRVPAQDLSSPRLPL